MSLSGKDEGDMSQPQYVTPELRQRNIQTIASGSGNIKIRINMIEMVASESPKVWLTTTSAMLPLRRIDPTANVTASFNCQSCA
jgi:hypothetical protein